MLEPGRWFLAIRHRSNRCNPEARYEMRPFGAPPRVCVEHASHENPTVVKKRLAHRIVRMDHGEAAANRAAYSFESQSAVAGFQSRSWNSIASNRSRPRANGDDSSIVEAVFGAGLAPLKIAGRRPVTRRAVRIDAESVATIDRAVDPEATGVIRVGRNMHRSPTADDFSDSG